MTSPQQGPREQGPSADGSASPTGEDVDWWTAPGPCLLVGFAMGWRRGDRLVDGVVHGLEDVLVGPCAPQDVADLADPVRDEQGDAVAAQVTGELGEHLRGRDVDGRSCGGIQDDSRGGGRDSVTDGRTDVVGVGEEQAGLHADDDDVVSDGEVGVACGIHPDVVAAVSGRSARQGGYLRT